MSEDERSPKRQRRSYSPASPPTGETKAAIVHQPPQTPPPSVHMSPSCQSQSQSQLLPGLGMQAGSNTGSVTFPTPPSTAGFQSQMMARGTSSDGGGVESEQQTPVAVETDGVAKRDGDGDADMRESPRGAGGEGGDVSMTEDVEHRRTDHEREEGGDSALQLASPEGADVLYKLSTEPIPSSQPLLSENLFDLYSLQRIQGSVARRDPVTGEKINVLRKSYAGKVKGMGLEGHNKATKNNFDLQGLLDPTWDLEVQDGQTVWQLERGSAILGDHDTNELFSKLDTALDLRPGHLPRADHEHWKSYLGLDESATAAVAKPLTMSTSALAAQQPTKTAASNFLAKTAPGAALRNSAPASPRNNIAASRPERTGKKRRYDESSYEGYEDDGYSTGGVDDTSRRGSGGGGKRQKRKDFNSSANSPPFNAGSGSMVGVRSS